MNILSIPCTNYFPNRLGLTPRYIILHGTAGGLSAAKIANYFVETQGTANPVASNFVIDQAGTIVQCVDPKHGAWANGALTADHDNFWDPNINPNNLTISIEHVKSALDNSNSLTEAQQAASFWLIDKLCTDWNIPRHLANAAGGITGHYSLDPVNRQNCPGPYPTDALIHSLNPPISTPPKPEETVLQLSQVSNFFVQGPNPTYWHCPKNNVTMGGAILTFYRTFGQVGLNGLSIFGLPKTGEIHVSGKKAAIVQRYERGVILYDPLKECDSVPGLPGPCYPAHIDVWGSLIGFPVTAPAPAPSSGISQAAIAKDIDALLAATTTFTTSLEAAKKDLTQKGA